MALPESKSSRNPLKVALSGKGVRQLSRRASRILRRYGLNTGNFDGQLTRLAHILHKYDCRGTFPITSVALHRNPQIIQKYQQQGLEFAIHGYRHIDHSELTLEEQYAHIDHAQQVFKAAGVQVNGFRGPYLRWNNDTLTSLRAHGIAYDSSQGLYWDVMPAYDTAAYRHVLGFYRAKPAAIYPSLPWLEADLVQIPYSLPDDEALIERLSLRSLELLDATWLKILYRTYELGELFTIGLHPERTILCESPLQATLRQARSLYPHVWLASLKQIAAWWKARSDTRVKLIGTHPHWKLDILGPPGLSILARNLTVHAPTQPWSQGYRVVQANQFTIEKGDCRPWIGVSPHSAPALTSFLRQQGYIVEVSHHQNWYNHYFNQPKFAPEQQRAILTHIENSPAPLVRLGRWPNQARSALSVTGDIDALTLWDYSLRFLGQ